MTPSEFKELYPLFVTRSDAEVQSQLTLFGLLYKGCYGDVGIVDHLTGLFAAHQLYVSGKSGGGAVQTIGSRSVGDVSTSYAASGPTKAGDFALSKYGVEFYRLISLFGGGPLITR